MSKVYYQTEPHSEVLQRIILYTKFSALSSENTKKLTFLNEKIKTSLFRKKRGLTFIAVNRTICLKLNPLTRTQSAYAKSVYFSLLYMIRDFAQYKIGYDFLKRTHQFHLPTRHDNFLSFKHLFHRILRNKPRVQPF